jgi:hypothetical protein
VDYGASLENWFPYGTMGSNPIPCATFLGSVGGYSVHFLLVVYTIMYTGKRYYVTFWY